MTPKEPTRQQLSSRLTYSQHTPTFLRKLQSRVSGAPNEDSDEDPEFEDDGSGRPPIPRRPPVPERPADDPGSEDEDGDDEAPQVVVLKEGKHLSAWEAENEKRRAKGLPPVPDPWVSKSAVTTTRSGDAMDIKTNNKEANSKEKTSLSFSSGSSLPSRSAAAKRKAAAVGDGRGEDDDEGADEDLASRVRVAGAASLKAKSKKKRPKVGLSFMDDT